MNENNLNSNFERNSSNWTTELLASRLYVENNSLNSKNNKKNNNNNNKLNKELKTINSNLKMSQSTPSLKIINSSSSPSFPSSNLNNSSSPSSSNLNSTTLNNNLERKATLKTSKIIQENNRNLLKKAVLPSPSLGNSASFNNLLPPLDSKLDSDSHHPQQQQHNNNNSSSNDVVSKNNVPTTFLQSLNLSSKLHHELFHVPHTFFYLQSKMAIDTKAYDLQLISQDKVDKNQYYTISKEGITLHRASDSEFTSLAQWEREYSLFHQISVIPFFRQYRRWKVMYYLF